MAFDKNLSELVIECGKEARTAGELIHYFASQVPAGGEAPDKGFTNAVARGLAALTKGGWLTVDKSGRYSAGQLQTMKAAGEPSLAKSVRATFGG